MARLALTALDRDLAQRVERSVGTFFAPRLAGVSNDRWDKWTEGRGRMSAEERSHLSRLAYAGARGDLPRGVREAIADKPRRQGPTLVSKWLDLRARDKRTTSRQRREWRDFVADELDLDPDDAELQDT